MTKNRFALQLLLGFVLVALGHALLNAQFRIISWQELLKMDSFVFGLLLFTFLLMRKEMGGAREQFVAKFMIITTVQMLAVMSILLFISYSGKNNARMIILNQVSFFVAVLFVQSLVLIRSRK